MSTSLFAAFAVLLHSGAALPGQSTAAPLDYEGSLRCNGILAYIVELGGDSVHPTIRAGATDSRLLARVFGNDLGKSLEVINAEIETEKTRQFDRLDLTDFREPATQQSVGAEIDLCLARVAATN